MWNKLCVKCIYSVVRVLKSWSIEISSWSLAPIAFNKKSTSSLVRAVSPPTWVMNLKWISLNRFRFGIKTLNKSVLAKNYLRNSDACIVLLMTPLIFCTLLVDLRPRVLKELIIGGFQRSVESFLCILQNKLTLMHLLKHIQGS